MWLLQQIERTPKALDQPHRADPGRPGAEPSFADEVRGDDGTPSGGLNIDATAQKERERAADRFAANLIRAAFLQRSRATAMMDAAFVSMNLGNLSFNPLRICLVDHFGATTGGRLSSAVSR